MATLGVREIIELNECRNWNTTKRPKPANTVRSKASNKWKGCGRLSEKVFGSRWIGFLIGPLYGMFIFYYISYLILDGPPFTVKTQPSTANDVNGHVDVNQMGVDAVKGVGVKVKVNENDGTNSALEDNAPVILDKQLSYVIGASIGGGTGILLAVGSVFSAKVRCGMMLVIPSLCAKRGRSFMLTAAAGFLLAGPIATIDYNIQQVVTSFTCMYEQVKTMADLYVEQFKKIWEDVMKIFDHLNDMMKEYRRHLAELAENATDDVKRQIDAAKEDMERKARELKDKLSKLKGVLDAPGDAAGWICDKGKSVVALGTKVGKSAGKWFKGAANSVGNAFKSFGGSLFGRKKRSTCGIPDMIPDIDLDAEDVNLDALKKFLKRLKPDIDLVDIDLKNIFSELEHSSIADIRARLKLVLKMVFNTVRTYSGYIEKIFYLSIVLVIRDALKYMKKYYSDDSHDNMMVDDNLRNLWRSSDKTKIIPLRKWELKQKYQYSAAAHISKSEAKRILINAIPALLFAIIVVCILVTDYALTHILTVFREEGQFGISYEGMEQGVSFNSLLDGMKSGDLDVSALKLEGFNLTTEPCLPRARTTDLSSLSVVITLVVISLISCICDAYGSRLRAKICNMYFPERARERAEYLYKRIITGRSTRRIQLQMIVGREMDRRNRERQFCPCWSRLYALTCGRANKDTCPSCWSVLAKKDQSTYDLKRNGKVVEIPICNDCLLDRMI